MAINVDTVYRTVLLIMNKEQRGYLTPEEFNKIGQQAQLEIFNSYFEELNQQLRTTPNDSEYANRIKNIEHKLELFKMPPTLLTFNAASGASTQFFTPPLDSTLVASQTITTTTDQVYNLTATPEQVKDGVLKVFLGAAEIVSPADYFISTPGTQIQLTSIPAAGLDLLIQVFDNNFYKLGSVIYNSTVEAEEVSQSYFLKANISPLAQPTISFPLYIYEKGRIFIKPTSIDSSVSATYIRKPISPKWDFTVDSTTQAYVYDYNQSVNFELDPIEQSALIMRILLYAGVIIKDPQVVQVAASQIQQEQANEKS